MTDPEGLYRYIGKEYNETIKVEIEGKFSPYKIMICDVEYFCLELDLTDTIRCVVEDGRIMEIDFN